MDSSYSKATDFAVYLIEETQKLYEQGLTVGQLDGWLLVKWHEWAMKVNYPKPWPYLLKPMMTFVKGEPF